jgi:5-formyltetrahydrofolate cyclo-ligase
MNKAEMRGEMKGFLAALSAAELQDRSRRAAERFQQVGAWMWMDILFCFLSMPGELATEGLIHAARKDGKSVAVPRMEDGDIRFVALPADAPEPPRDRWGIPVPDPAWPGVDLARAGRILVCAPGLAFDRQGNRLGRGRGYYDRFLTRARASGAGLVAIGICFSGQVVTEVPHGAADQRLDGLVTDGETVLFDRDGLIR